ncbi:PseudoU-synth-2 domain-containing protein [Mycena venus]|uniref:PseudoU-synth-2 domain-containing protein n=1 Tax=Mycena venus TaxID=2733690 RepID=A0A8H6YQ41_9AGAR|nr:PseudoU-synth-2 domain-containing protein [Mycena venus]
MAVAAVGTCEVPSSRMAITMACSMNMCQWPFPCKLTPLGGARSYAASVSEFVADALYAGMLLMCFHSSPLMQLILLIACLFIFLLCCYTTYKHFTRISVAGVRGPESSSWLLGNMPELFGGQVGEAEFKWQEIYGGVVRIKASFGEDRLLVTDPKALQYIYQTSGYRFHKQPERIELTRMIRYAQIIPHESPPESMLAGVEFYGQMETTTRDTEKLCFQALERPKPRPFLPLFFSYAAQIGAKWKDIIGATADQSAVLDVTGWASRATLDAIGEAAFDYRFGAMENADNIVGTAYSNVFMNTFGSPSDASLLALSLLQYLPRCIREFLVDHVPSQGLEHIRYTAQVTTTVARELVATKSAALLQGKGSRDIMSLLVKANASENEKTKLNEDELLSQMRTIIMAGHETTANSFSWAVLELARQPKIQSRLRSEIRSMERMVQARGSYEFTTTDIESMPYLLAVVKVCSSRFSIPVQLIQKIEIGSPPLPSRILQQLQAKRYRRCPPPLFRPLTLRSGEVITELPIPKGMKVIISIAAYNRNKAPPPPPTPPPHPTPPVFGHDAHIFKPERWLDGSMGKPEAPVGAYANLLTFAGGLRTCIGWRFAVLELQAFLIELVSNFEFSLTPEAMHIRREACIVMCPTVEGERGKGTQLPLRVSVASREYD